MIQQSDLFMNETLIPAKTLQVIIFRKVHRELWYCETGEIKFNTDVWLSYTYHVMVGECYQYCAV